MHTYTRGRKKITKERSTATKAPAKRSQHANTTCHNIVGRNVLRAFGHRVAMCCDMLAVVGSSLKLVKFEPTTPNTSQHVATRWPNARNMLRPTMLRYVALVCCDRLAGALEIAKLIDLKWLGQAEKNLQIPYINVEL